MTFPLSRLMSTATATYGVYALANPRHLGHVVATNDSTAARGESPVPVGRNSSTSGRSTGRSSSGTGTSPQRMQYTIGIGGPQ